MEGCLKLPRSAAAVAAMLTYADGLGEKPRTPRAPTPQRRHKCTSSTREDGLGLPEYLLPGETLQSATTSPTRSTVLCRTPILAVSDQVLSAGLVQIDIEDVTTVGIPPSGAPVPVLRVRGNPYLFYP